MAIVTKTTFPIQLTSTTSGQIHLYSREMAWCWMLSSLIHLPVTLEQTYMYIVYCKLYMQMRARAHTHTDTPNTRAFEAMKEKVKRSPTLIQFPPKLKSQLKLLEIDRPPSSWLRGYIVSAPTHRSAATHFCVFCHFSEGLASPGNDQQPMVSMLRQRKERQLEGKRKAIKRHTTSLIMHRSASIFLVGFFFLLFNLVFCVLFHPPLGMFPSSILC